jgi:hypothetical protein
MQNTENIYKQFRLLTDWYISALEGIDDKEGSSTIGDTNSFEWIAGHLVVGRYRTAMRLGMEVAPYPHLDQFANSSAPPPNAIAFNRNIQYPSLTNCREHWMKYSALILEKLEKADEALLSTTLALNVPIGGNTLKDMLAFTALHESYHIGQLSILRKSMGKAGFSLGLIKK